MAGLVCPRHSFHQIRLQTTAANSTTEVPIPSTALSLPQVIETSEIEIDGERQAEEYVVDPIPRPPSILKVFISPYIPS